MSVDVDLIRTLVTLASFIAFLAIVCWAYAPARKPRFEDQGRMIFREDGE